LKGLPYLEPLRIVNEETETERDKNSSVSKEERSELVAQVEEGLRYHAPEAVEEGVNGSYFLRDKDGKIIAVFKPTDEEGNSENNPKKSPDSEEEEDFVKRGIGRGEGAIREVAAYRLDRGHFAGVPETVMASLSHLSFPSVDGEEKKTGSLQAFVDNDGPSWDIGPSKFPVREVHKIGVLDMRIFNNDRHGGNMLMRENFDNGKIELIPIDHGLSLSSTLDHAWFEWLNWPQAKIPFDDETRAYIDSINVEEDAQMLRELGLKEEAIRTMIISSTLLKMGSAAGLTLFHIGTMACRVLDQPSLLEKLVDRAHGEALESDGLPALWRILESEIAASNG